MRPAGFGFGLDAALLHEIKHGRQQAEAEGGISEKQGNNVRDEPAIIDAFWGNVCGPGPARE